MKTYAGIGSRETPADVLWLMEQFAHYLAGKHNYYLRSGGAIGADKAFQRGAGNKSLIYRPEHSTAEAEELASKYHPAWDRCDEYARKLHGRNMMIVLGWDLNSPVDFIVCWTKDGKATGGTGQALRLAEDRGIVVENLFFEDIQELVKWKLNQP